MSRFLRLMFFLAGMSGFLGSAIANENVDGWWNQLGLHDLNGGPVTAKGKWIVVVFISPECPVANASIPVLNSLAREFAPVGVDFVGVYADPTLKVSALRQHASDYRLGFPTVDDRNQRLVHLTGATYTPETFVFSHEGALLYRGRIDDRVSDFSSGRPAATHEDLHEVLRALAAEKELPFSRRPGFGCTIPEAIKR